MCRFWLPLEVLISPVRHNRQIKVVLVSRVRHNRQIKVTLFLIFSQSEASLLLPVILSPMLSLIHRNSAWHPLPSLASRKCVVFHLLKMKKEWNRAKHMGCVSACEWFWSQEDINISIIFSHWSLFPRNGKWKTTSLLLVWKLDWKRIFT